mgnify:FL=1
MAFLYPYFLLLALAIGIPIAIHLFNFHRFKQVIFTNVSMLKDLAIATKKQNKLYERLLLLFRCLIILFLALLFAQPYIKSTEKQLAGQGSNAVVIFVDNSFSMQNIAEKGSMIETAKIKAQDILSQFSDNDVFCLLTMDMEGKHKHFVSKQMFKDFLNDIEISSASYPYSKILNTAHHLLNLRNETNKRVFFISDFQISEFDSQNIKEDSTILDVFLPLQAKNLNNIFVDTISMDRNIYQKGQKVDIQVSIQNISNEDIEDVPVKLYIDNKQQSIANVSLKKMASLTLPMSFVIQNTGVLEGRISILDHPIVYDNEFYFTLNVKDKIKVLVLNSQMENKYINRLFGNSEEIFLENMSENNIDFSKFANCNAIILNSLTSIPSGLANELKKFRGNGGTLVLIPATQINKESYNAALEILEMPSYADFISKETKVIKFDNKNALYKNVFTSISENLELPKANKYYKISKQNNRSSQDIMTFASEDAFLIESSDKISHAYMFATPLNEEFTDFVAQSTFVPTLWNMVLYAQNLAKPFLFMNDNAFVDLSLYTDNLKSEIISLKQKDIEIIPQMTMESSRKGFKIQNQIKKDGYYSIFDGENKIGELALNYPRQESDLRFLNSNDIEKQLEISGYKNINVFNDRKMIGTYFADSKKGFDFTYLILSLLVLCIIGESLVLWKMKNK